MLKIGQKSHGTRLKQNDKFVVILCLQRNFFSLRLADRLSNTKKRMGAVREAFSWKVLHFSNGWCCGGIGVLGRHCTNHFHRDPDNESLRCGRWVPWQESHERGRAFRVNGWFFSSLANNQHSQQGIGRKWRKKKRKIEDSRCVQ